MIMNVKRNGMGANPLGFRFLTGEFRFFSSGTSPADDFLLAISKAPVLSMVLSFGYP